MVGCREFLGLLFVLGFKISLMGMFWAFKLRIDVEILVFLGHFFQKLGEILMNYLVTLIVEHDWLHFVCFQIKMLVFRLQVKPECPLCKARFKSIIHTIKSDQVRTL